MHGFFTHIHVLLQLTDKQIQIKFTVMKKQTCVRIKAKIRLYIMIYFIS